MSFERFFTFVVEIKNFQSYSSDEITVSCVSAMLFHEARVLKKEIKMNHFHKTKSWGFSFLLHHKT